MPSSSDPAATPDTAPSAALLGAPAGSATAAAPYAALWQVLDPGHRVDRDFPSLARVGQAWIRTWAERLGDRTEGRAAMPAWKTALEAALGSDPELLAAVVWPAGSHRPWFLGVQQLAWHRLPITAEGWAALTRMVQAEPTATASGHAGHAGGRRPARSRGPHAVLQFDWEAHAVIERLLSRADVDSGFVRALLDSPRQRWRQIALVQRAWDVETLDRLYARATQVEEVLPLLGQPHLRPEVRAAWVEAVDAAMDPDDETPQSGRMAWRITEEGERLVRGHPPTEHPELPWIPAEAALQALTCHADLRWHWPDAVHEYPQVLRALLSRATRALNPAHRVRHEPGSSGEGGPDAPWTAGEVERLIQAGRLHLEATATRTLATLWRRMPGVGAAEWVDAVEQEVAEQSGQSFPWTQEPPAIIHAVFQDPTLTARLLAIPSRSFRLDVVQQLATWRAGRQSVDVPEGPVAGTREARQAECVSQGTGGRPAGG